MVQITFHITDLRAGVACASRTSSTTGCQANWERAEYAKCGSSRVSLRCVWLRRNETEGSVWPIQSVSFCTRVERHYQLASRRLIFEVLMWVCVGVAREHGRDDCPV